MEYRRIVIRRQLFDKAMEKYSSFGFSSAEIDTIWARLGNLLGTQTGLTEIIDTVLVSPEIDITPAKVPIMSDCIDDDPENQNWLRKVSKVKP